MRKLLTPPLLWTTGTGLEKDDLIKNNRGTPVGAPPDPP